MLNLALAAALALNPTVTPIVLNVQSAPLHGTLLSPDGQPRAAAVIIAGSGPTDRDGNSPMGLRAAPYRLLAEALAERGIATLRYDKRGIGESATATGREEDLSFDLAVDDALAFAAETRRRTGQPCAWLIGHSEGAGIALAAVARGGVGVCGVALVSGAGRPARAVIEEQLGRQLPEPMRTQAFAALAQLEAGQLVTDPPPALAALLRPSVQPYLISWLAQNPTAQIAAYHGWVLIAQGENDLQTSVADARLLAAAQPNATLVIWPGVNHILKVAPIDRDANFATYGDPALPLASQVVEDIAAFILATR